MDYFRIIVNPRTVGILMENPCNFLNSQKSDELPNIVHIAVIQNALNYGSV